MSDPSGAGVRISLASPEADLAAVVWPGVSTVYHPRTESARQIQAVAARIAELERLRGIRPGSVGVVPLVETPRGVAMAREIASSSARICAFGVGPNIGAGLGIDEPGLEADLLMYARAECELHARALGLEPLDMHYLLD
jgi:citrate lyase subunit beta / citryl-CoA lyase